eukprot:CAMPEP_0185737230 /NCGR_PEP_ID=MMETSP1171-20130828/29964_1 /TAXON_ID=374046 /ORGANISM="Helicotheca tamensis, Strain CCMP826" /LENGTH=160 /DNA_ID=CAMNT_0028408105 /DNA_START=191 /DNA_END=673 /DNA_ORIENTATION=-
MYKKSPKIIACTALLFLVGYSFSSICPSSANNNEKAKMTEDMGSIPSTATDLSTEGFGFEVHGKVQGVNFRKYTQQKANSLDLLGWVRNTPIGTVVGEAVSPANSNAKAETLEEMKHWLQHIGSPMSRIDKVEFSTLTDAQLDKTREEGVFKQIRHSRRL